MNAIESFRQETREWLAAELSAGRAWSGPDPMGRDTRPARRRRAAVARTDGGARLDRADVAARVRRRGTDAGAISRAARRTAAHRRALAADRPRRELHRADAARLRHAAAESALAARHRPRRRRLVHGLFGTRRRLGPCEPEHARGARRRPLRHQRPQDVDVGCDGVRLHLRAGAHRPRRAETRRHQPDPDRHGPERRAGAADPADQRQFAVQRNVVRRRDRAA